MMEKIETDKVELEVRAKTSRTSTKNTPYRYLYIPIPSHVVRDYDFQEGDMITINIKKRDGVK